MDKKIQYTVKRIFDLLFSLVLLICSSPFLLLAMATVRLRSPEAPVFFKQVRSGYKGREFTIYKLRTMTNERDADGRLLPDEQRLKRWGKIIRKTNIDEIPQVFNILKGEMSLIGPRPVLPVDVEKFNAYQMHRQDILPGISGSFILLLMGKYDFVLNAVHELKSGMNIGGNFCTLLLFMFGIFIGIAGFIRLLSYLLQKFHDITIAVLIGFMLGSLRKVWPWKFADNIENHNILPGAIDGNFWFAVLLGAIGFILVLVIEYAARKREDMTP